MDCVWLSSSLDMDMDMTMIDVVGEESMRFLLELENAFYYFKD